MEIVPQVTPIQVESEEDEGIQDSVLRKVKVSEEMEVEEVQQVNQNEEVS